MTEVFDEIFPNPPIESVSCEIRFPALLTIKDSIPQFQSNLRNEFPEYYTQIIPRARKSGIIDERWWTFKSSDDNFGLKIKNSSIVLTSTDYKEFTPFFEIINTNFENFFVLNSIDKYLRIGLRYTNREQFEDKEPNLRKLLEYFNLKHFTFEENEPINNFALRYNKVESGLYMTVILEYSKNPQGKYEFLFDFDSYTSEEVDKEHYIGVIENLHHNILIVFNEIITEEYKNNVLRVEQ